ncbi:hypothetical protein K8P63_13885 [Sphingomonas nostoxanthinifaciens]|nr:hypothetical protein K8P63_13885 [Sphingomonas nostoxanthinifaciens]
MGELFRADAGQPYPSAIWAARADANHDGAIDRAEFVADARRFFATLDTDHDGRLTPEEVIAYERDVAPEIALYGGRSLGGEGQRGGRSGLAEALGLGGGGGSDYGGPMGAGRFAWLNIPEPVAAADLDIDRVVSEQEFMTAAGRRFDTLDAKQAGVLRLAELPRTPAQIAIEGPCRPRPKPRKDRRPDEQDNPR